MADGVAIGMQLGGLEQGSAAAAATADASAVVVHRLAGVSLDGAAFGQVDRAGPLAAVLGLFVSGVGHMGRRVAEQHADLSRRAATTAGQGDQMTSTTTAVAEQSALGVDTRPAG
jgi:hypothetical protein